MKLSIEEKAKRYDDAIEIARAKYAMKDQPIHQDLADIFPELKESEDERMIQYFKDLAPFDKAEELYEKYGFSHKDAIAWLEKQGEQKPAAWSEEDEKLLDNTIKFIENCIAATPPSLRTYNPILTGKEVPFLKSLKGRVQPKQDWSEEDETCLTNIIIMLKEGASLHFVKGDIIKSVEWLKNRLKSLRPQKRWKPSEEQMDELKRAYGSREFDHTVLESLYNDLLKTLTE